MLKGKKLAKPIYTGTESFKNLQLEKRISELEKQMNDSAACGWVVH
jgi:hypothetical protein